MKNKTIFLTDIDNVCLDYSKGFLSYVDRKYPDIRINEDLYSYGLDTEVLVSLTAEFIKSEHFGNLEPLRDAQQILPKLNKLGYIFHGVTSCLPDKETKTYLNVHKSRMENLKKVFGDCFTGCTMIMVGESKTKYLENFESTYYVDDKEKHVDSGTRSGHKSLLMNHVYNQYSSEYIRVNNWEEILRIIENEEII